VADDSPVLGRPSAAAAETVPLRTSGDARSAAFRAEGGDSGWCAMRAASVAGVRHRLAGEPGQDSFAWSLSGTSVALAVADGLGTVPGSEGAAARAAVAAVAAAAAEATTAGGTALGTVAAAARTAAATVGAGTVTGALTSEDRVARALAAAEVAAGGGGATTLVIAVLEPGGRGCLARVGDSTAFLVGDAGMSWEEVFSPPDDERDVNATAALPAHPAAEWATVELGRADVLVLATDGVADPWRDGPTTVAPALVAAVAAHPTPLELARLAGFSRQGCHDDRTMVLFWPSSGTTGTAPEADGPSARR
jgi:serine/threonine protein phosphatase PrpC